MMNFLWDLHQQTRIDEVSSRVDALKHGTSTNSQVERLQQRVDALVLENLALWTILRDKLGVTDAQLEARVRELDLADGHLDGKVRVGPWTCSACNRPNAPKHSRCLYCGHQSAASGVFPV